MHRDTSFLWPYLLCVGGRDIVKTPNLDLNVTTTKTFYAVSAVFIARTDRPVFDAIYTVFSRASAPSKS